MILIPAALAAAHAVLPEWVVGKWTSLTVVHADPTCTGYGGLISDFRANGDYSIDYGNEYLETGTWAVKGNMLALLPTRPNRGPGTRTIRIEELPDGRMAEHYASGPAGIAARCPAPTASQSTDP